ncbi:Elongation of very long chain fatty acids protein 5 [Rhizoclosmatium hyalinum]|nr:Elongation of very long chain fatty acids protein 5 [Rhizoclosmatium hyalinum]
MDINAFLDTITDKSVLVQAFRTSPEDAFIHVFNVTGNLLEPYTNSITIQLEKYIPSSFVALKFPAHINSLPFMNPVHVVMSMVGYLLMIAIGTTVMRGFSKFEAKTLAFYHNTFLTLLNAYMMIGIAEEAVFEFIDTFIMILKKNNHQISFLHVYHHTSVLLVAWFVVYFVPGGDSWTTAALNSLIHVVMYGYYLLSSMGFKQVSFIKKYITRMQMTQFCILMVQGLGNTYLYPFYAQIEGLNPVNPYPVVCSKIQLAYMASMLGLFLNFYIQDRKRDKARLAALKKKANAEPGVANLKTTKAL